MVPYIRPSASHILLCSLKHSLLQFRRDLLCKLEGNDRFRVGQLVSHQ
jgi:hypothetical protein